MMELHLPWLELAILIPILGALWIGRIREAKLVRRQTLFVCAITLGLAIGEWIDFGTLHTFEAHDHWDLVHRVTTVDILVVDELSAPLLPLTALVFLMTVLSTLPSKAGRFPFRSALILLGMCMAILSCREPWVIVSLVSLMCVPVAANIRERKRSSTVFYLHMGMMSALLGGGQLVLSLPGVEGNVRLGGVLLLTFGCLVRSGIVPVHCWLTDMFEKASMGISLLFVSPMIGAYLTMRLVYPVAPSWLLKVIAGVSLVTAIYAGGMALVQVHSRRFFCCLFLGFSSLVLVGIELATPIGLTGALCIWLSVGLSLAGFGLSLRSLEARTGRLSLRDYHGLYEHTPKLAALFLLTGLASIGFPGTIGFIGTELLVEGAVTFFPAVGIAVVTAAALNGIAILSVYFKVFTGTVHQTTVDLRSQPPERIALLVLAVLIIGGGIVPQPGVASRYHAARALLTQRERMLATDGESSPSIPALHGQITEKAGRMK